MIRTDSSRPEELAHQARAERLLAVPAFAELPSAAAAALAEVAEHRLYKKGEEILREGEPGRSLHLMLGGRAKMQRALPNGRTLVLSLFHPGDLFGAVTALGGQACNASVVALDATSCLAIDRDELYGLFRRRPELVGEILPALTQRLVECSNCIVEMSCYRVEMRFAQLLLKFADSVGRQEPGGTLIPIPLSRQELADMTGTTIESCIRIMSRWAKEQTVETRRDGFLVRDRPRLEELARA